MDKEVDEYAQEFEQIEQEAREITEDIRNLEEINEAKKYEMNALATKYELLKSKYDQFVKMNEEKFLKEVAILQTRLVIPRGQNPGYLQSVSSSRKQILKTDERKQPLKIKRGVGSAQPQIGFQVA